jgi:hypothetical protein
MSKILLIATLFLICGHSKGQQFYNRYPSSLDLHIYTGADVLELNNEYYKVECESNNSLNFHANIRLIKTDASGNIIWVKRYDAGNDSSLTVTSISKTIDNHIVIDGYLALDNTFPGIGVTLINLDTSGAVTWTALFPGFRSGYHSNNILQLPDSSFLFDAESSASLNSCLINVSQNASGVASRVFGNMVYNGSEVTSMLLDNNQLSFSFDHGEFVTTDLSFNVLTDRAYNLDPSEAYFAHGITSNGDLVFISDIIGGGLLNGRCRIFRTDAAGTLLWAKSLTIWKSFTSHTNFNLYDVVNGVKVFEDTSYNIVAHLMDEGGLGLMLTFDSSGNYISNKVIMGNQMELCADGDFLFGANLQFANALGMFGKQSHYSINNCDSLLDVYIDPGTDSASSIAPAAILTPVAITVTPFPVSMLNDTITPALYCPVSTWIPDHVSADADAVKFYPNPSGSKIHLTLPENDSDVEMYNYAGSLLAKFSITGKEYDLDVSGLARGFYLLTIRQSVQMWNFRFVKE